MLNSYPQELLQQKCQLIVKEVLKEGYVEFGVADFLLRESDQTEIECRVYFSNEWEDISIQGVGAGPVDALYTALVEHLSPAFVSLKNVFFDDFTMKADFKESVRKSAAPVCIKLSLKNHSDRNIFFSANSHSLVSAAPSVVVSACEYLINAEIAFIELKSLIADARRRSRIDLVDFYIEKMVSLVGIATYEEVAK